LNYTRNLANDSRLAVSGRTQSILIATGPLLIIRNNSRLITQDESFDRRARLFHTQRPQKKPPTLDLAPMPNSFATLYLYLFWIFALLPAPRRKNNIIKQLSYFPTKFRRNWWRG